MQVSHCFSYPLGFVDAGEHESWQMMSLRLQILRSHPYNKKSLKKYRSTWMFLNGRAKKNRPGEWCALELLVQYGIVDYLLTHTP